MQQALGQVLLVVLFKDILLLQAGSEAVAATKPAAQGSGVPRTTGNKLKSYCRRARVAQQPLMPHMPTCGAPPPLMPHKPVLCYPVC